MFYLARVIQQYDHLSSRTHIFFAFQTCLQYLERPDLCAYRQCDVEILHNVMCLIIANCIPHTTTPPPQPTPGPTPDPTPAPPSFVPSPWWSLLFFIVGAVTATLCTVTGVLIGMDFFNLILAIWRLYSLDFSTAHRSRENAEPAQPELRERQMRPILRLRDPSPPPSPHQSPVQPSTSADVRENTPLLGSMANQNVDLDTEHAMYERI